MTTRAHQITKDNALVAPENRQEIGKCNMRIDPKMKRPKETTYQVVLDALALTTCYLAFMITADVPIIYMHQFWDTVHKHDSLYRFKIDNRKFAIDVEVFREILDICPRIEEIKYLTDITVDHLHQPWRTFAAIINKCLSGKIENKDAKKTDKMYYPRFTKAIINHYIKQNPSISFRNKLFMHTARDDIILGILKFVSKNEDVQTYYAIATGVAPPKIKKHRKADSFKSFEETLTRKSPRIKRSAKVSPVKSKKKAPAKADTGKSLKILSDVAMSKEAQLKEALRLSKQDVHISQASGSGAGIDEGTSTIPGVPGVPKVDLESEAESWGDSDDEDDVDIDKSDNESNDDDDDGDDNDDEGNDDADDDDEQKDEEEENVDIDFSDSEDDEEKDEEEEDDFELLYRDVNVNLHGDVDMTNAAQSGAQPKDQEPVLQYEDAHVTLIAS
ncbi:hypothetical protein Tco_0011807 [Tanacetum coccineum]